MSPRSASPYRLLVAEGDPALQETLVTLLQFENFLVTAASSLPDAQTRVREQTYHLVLTDLFDINAVTGLTALNHLAKVAMPTPVGLLTTLNLKPDLDTSFLTFVLGKPFDLDELLTSIGAALHAPLDPTVDQEAAIIQAFFDALNRRDWDAIAQLCTEDVIYLPPSISPHSEPIVGWPAYRDYLEQRAERFPDHWFGDVLIYPHPSGLAARYTYHATNHVGQMEQLSMAVAGRFAAGKIAQIGHPSIFPR